MVKKPSVVESQLSTEELAALLFFNPHEMVEARLLIGAFRCTHFLCFNGQTLSDEGIDGQTRRLPLREWVAWYAQKEWLLDQWPETLL